MTPSTAQLIAIQDTEREFPLFGELVADQRGIVMTTLLELNENEWVTWNGCEIERVDIIEAMEWATEFFMPNEQVIFNH